MEARETSLARAVRSARGAYDASCKRLLLERQVIARVLAGAVSGFEGVDPAEAARDLVVGEPTLGEPLGRDAPADPGPALALSTEDGTEAEGQGRFDVRARAIDPSTGELVELDLEAQGTSRLGYPLLRRAMYYCGRMLSQQGASVVARSRYGALRRVVTVWVVADPPAHARCTLWRAAMAGEPLVGAPAWDERDYARAEVVAACLGAGAREAGGLLGMLDALLGPGLAAEERLALLAGKYGMMVTEPIEEGVRDVCTMGEALVMRTTERVRREMADEIRQEMADEITRDVTDRVTKDVTDRVTRDVAERTRRETIAASARALMASLAAATAEAALDMLQVTGADRAEVLSALAE